MTTLAIETHDVEALSLAEGESAPRARIPAVVRWDDRGLLVGEKALDGARFLPRQVHDRFWRHLSLEALDRPFPDTWRTADLAHAHLEGLWQHSGQGIERVLLVTGGLDSAHLPLALGIARAVNLPVAGLISSALAAAADLRLDQGKSTEAPPPSSRANLHVELYRHHTIATRLDHGSDSLSVERLEISDELSYRKIHRAHLRATAKAFVRATRFDPLAKAGDEQELHDRLPAWREALSRTERIDARLHAGGATVAIELSRQELAAAAKPHLDRLGALIRKNLVGRETSVLLGAQGARLIFADSLDSELQVRSLDALAPSRGALAFQQEILEAGPQVEVQRLASPKLVAGTP